MTLLLVPLHIGQAKLFIEEHHRHNRVPTGGLFAVGVAADHGLCGAAVAGRPVAQAMPPGVVEITRCCTDGTPNACSMLYGALCRAARALGYDLVVTYTLTREPGTSLRASGFHAAALVAYRSWDSRDRPRPDFDKHGPVRPIADKIRWERVLG